MKDVEIKIDEQALKALFEGKRLDYVYNAGFGKNAPDPFKITIYPPRYGFFITHEKRAELEKRIYGRAFEEAILYLRTLSEDDKREIINPPLI
jgi:hypothetical protein